MNNLRTSFAESRRRFLGGALAAGASAALSARDSVRAADAPAPAAPPPPGRKIKLALIGCGGRGSWVGDLFTKHGGYEIVAVADYFPERAQKAGGAFGVPAERRFSGLGAYRKALASGAEAVTVVNVPHFHPQHARAAIEAGLHVYAAKPVAVDVPGALSVQETGRLATQRKLVYLVDYQMGNDPVNLEVVKRIHAGGLGRLMHIDSLGFSPPWGEPPIKTQEDRLRWWHATTALSGDVITENTVHSINAVLWAVGRRPVAAIGRSRIGRDHPTCEFRQVYLVTYEFEDGLLWTHRCQSLRNELEWQLKFDAYGDKATALVSYRGKSYVRGGPMHYGGGEVVSLYDQGAIRNIAEFHRAICEGRTDNPTVQQAGDDVLTAVLGREACTRGEAVTMEAILKENRALPFDLTGLVA